MNAPTICGARGGLRVVPLLGLTRTLKTGILLLAAWSTACSPAEQRPDAGTRAPATVTPDSGFATVADSEWVNITGVEMVGFYPVRTNEQLEKDEGLASALDNFAYHIGTAMDSLISAGATVHYRGGDTLWLRSPTRRLRFVRNADSSDIGYFFADTAGRSATVYGVKGFTELIGYVHEFRRTGQIRSQ